MISQKGGVGKTSIAISLATAIRIKGSRTLLIDGDTSNPTVGLRLGMEDANIGYKELVTRGAKLDNVKAIHATSGLHVVLGTLHAKPFIVKKSHINKLKKKIADASYDYVILDTSPGFYDEKDMNYWDEAILVTTPDVPSITGVMRLDESFRKLKIKRSLVLNKIMGKRYELQKDEIEDACGEKIAAVIPYDEIANVSMAEKIPAYIINRNAPYSEAIARLADNYKTGRKQAKAATKPKGRKLLPRFGRKGG